MSKTAYIFPGVGYTKDRPLLYYAGKIAASYGYRLVHMDFSGIKWSKEELKDPRRFAEILEECLARTDKVYSKECDTTEVLFISKSIGTVVATAFAREKNISVNQICFTPLEQIDNYAEDGNGLIFYGNADPYAEPDVIMSICDKKGLESHCIDNANHSLETGDVLTDIENINKIMIMVNEELKKL